MLKIDQGWLECASTDLRFAEYITGKIFTGYALQEGWTSFITGKKESDITSHELQHELLGYNFTNVNSGRDGQFHYQLYHRADCLVFIEHESRKIMWNIASPTFTQAQVAEDLLRNIIPDLSKDDVEGIVNVKFWMRGGQQIRSTAKKIASPSWLEIAENYHQETQQRLKALIDTKPPIPGGHLIVWRGLPGTGKTYAIRALCREWSEWCKSHYIVDAENLFQDMDYFYQVVTGQDREMFDEDGEIIGEQGKPWKLLIMEDADEFLTADAKERSGYMLSKLLNTMDGFLGQGLNLLMLMTMNSVDAKLHHAMTRPGRCFSQISFLPLNKCEAQRWCKKHKRKKSVTDTNILAELYHHEAAGTRLQEIGF